MSQGGVLIKLGQFLSTRVDVLPPAVTDELKGLQDEVPSESLADIRALIAAEFGRPVEQVFSCFEPVPEAAASLAQVHRACLMDGTKVVVKVQRPGIERLVATDLAAIRLALRWLKWYRRIARRVDLDQLYAEFSATTRAELDFIAEGHNADRFAANFADDPGVYIADVFWDYTTRRVLTLENVASIKINDFAAIDAAGISRPQLARNCTTLTWNRSSSTTSCTPTRIRATSSSTRCRAIPQRLPAHPRPSCSSSWISAWSR